MRDISSHISENELLPFSARFALASISDLPNTELDLLTPKEKEEVKGFTNQRRRLEYITSRATLRTLAQQIHDCDFVLEKDELGQPWGQMGQQKCYVSIAHTTKTVFCGLSVQAAIGVDLEPRTRKVPERLRQRILHPNEKNIASDLSTLQLWTMKEAFIKLRGQGLRLNMNEVQIQLQNEDFIVEINNDNRAKICSFQLYDHWLAIAYHL